MKTRLLIYGALAIAAGAIGLFLAPGVETLPHEEVVQPFLVKSEVGPSSFQNAIHPQKDDWVVISADGPDQSVDLTGWTVRSAVSGKSFTISPLGGTKHVRIGSRDTSATVHTVGLPSKSYFAEGEWHLYFGEATVAWGEEHDVIELVNPSGDVVDTYEYTSTPSGEDKVVQDILNRDTEGRYAGISVPAGVVFDPKSFAYARYYMKTAGRFYKDAKYLYWVVFPEPVYGIGFSITRVPNGDPQTFHALTPGSFDGSLYAADKNQFYCGPRPYTGIDPSGAQVLVRNGEEVVVTSNGTYHITGELPQLVTDTTKTCERIP